MHETIKCYQWFIIMRDMVGFSNFFWDCKWPCRPLPAGHTSQIFIYYWQSESRGNHSRLIISHLNFEKFQNYWSWWSKFGWNEIYLCHNTWDGTCFHTSFLCLLWYWIINTYVYIESHRQHMHSRPNLAPGFYSAF